MRNLEWGVGNAEYRMRSDEGEWGNVFGCILMVLYSRGRGTISTEKLGEVCGTKIVVDKPFV